MNFSISSNSAWSFSLSSPVSWRSLISTIALAWASENPNVLMRVALASSTFLEALMILMISSMTSIALSKPSNMWALFFAFSSSNLVLRTITSCLKSTNTLIMSLRVIVLGRPFTSATLFMAKLDWRGVYLNNVFSTTFEFAPCFTLKITRIPSRELSSFI